MISAQSLQAFANDGASKQAKAEDEDKDANTASAVEEPSDKFETLRPMLEEFSGEIENCCDEIDADTLMNPGVELTPEDSLILKQGVALLDPKLQEALIQASTKGITPEEAGDLGVHLESEGIVQDADLLAGWLYRVGRELGRGGARRLAVAETVD